MTPEAFIEEVGRMRAAQKAYFADRSRDNLAVAKALEAKVDKALVELARTGATPPAQRRPF